MTMHTHSHVAAALADIAAQLGAPSSVPVAVLREADDQPGVWLYHVREGDSAAPMQRLTEAEFDAWARGRLGPAYVIVVERRSPLPDGVGNERTTLNIANIGSNA